MIHFAPADPHPESYDLFRDALHSLEQAPATEVDSLGFRALWHLVSVLGFAPSLETCVLDGTALPAEGALPFNTREGGALCPACAAQHGASLAAVEQEWADVSRRLARPADPATIRRSRRRARHPIRDRTALRCSTGRPP